MFSLDLSPRLRRIKLCKPRERVHVFIKASRGLGARVVSEQPRQWSVLPSRLLLALGERRALLTRGQLSGSLPLK